MMRSNIRYFAPLFAAVGVGASIVLAPATAAAPECTNTSSTTTLCQTNGSAQIVTSPPVINNWGGWPWWGNGISIGFGGWGW
jgi:hypothetical protein